MMQIHFKRVLFLVCLFSISALGYAQDEDFTTWTNFKVGYKINSKFAISGNLEMRTEDDVQAIDRWGLSLGGEYNALSFLKLELGYETHYRNLGGEGWKFRHRYRLGATASYRYQWLKVSLRERFQQTFDRGEAEARLRSRLKLSCAPEKSIVAPYFSVEIYQSLDDAPFWRVARMRYRPGVEIDLAKKWSLDAFYCYQYEKSTGKHIAGIEVGYSF